MQTTPRQQVTKAEFFGRIGPLDAVSRPVGPWPYTTIFETRDRRPLGWIVKTIPDGKALPVPAYYLPA